MKVRTKVAIQTEAMGKWKPAGSVVDIDKADAIRLITSGAAVGLDTGAALEDRKIGLSKDKRGTASEELQQVKGVNRKNVGAVIDAGYTSIAELQKATIEQLAAIPGVRNAKGMLADASEFECD